MFLDYLQLDNNNNDVSLRFESRYLASQVYLQCFHPLTIIEACYTAKKRTRIVNRAQVMDGRVV